MILGLDLAGGSSYSSSIQTQEQITSLKIQNAIIKQVFITKKLSTTFDGTFDDTWTFDTVLSSKFENNLYGGNVNFTEKIVEQVRIKKRTKRDKKFQTIYEKSINTHDDLAIEFIDYCEPVGNIEYAYVAVISGVEDNYITTSVTSDFDSYFIVDGSTSYPCRFNTSFSTTHNYGAASVKPLNRKYPIAVINGITGYKSGTMEGVFIEPICNDSDSSLSTYEYREQIIDMLSNGSPKLLKTYEGELYMIGVVDDIEETNRTTVGDEEGYFDVVGTKFNWIECADAYDTQELSANGFIDVSSF